MLISALGITGCASRPEALPPDRSGVLPVGAIDPGKAEPMAPETVLVLSGGGAYGAFGAGFLNGWTQTGERPEFDTVTGISTGAILATAAFLGTEYDPLLREAYTSLETDDVYNPKFVPLALLSSSLGEQQPLEDALERLISDEMIDAVGEATRSERALYVGTTNLDTKSFVVWDMGKIARMPKPTAYTLYRKIILASSSLPVAYEPVYFEVEVEGQRFAQMHADGGVISPVFLESWMLSGADRRQAAQGRVFLLFNLPFGQPKYKAVDPALWNISLATLKTTLNSLNANALQSAFELAKDYEYLFRYTAVPRSQQETTNPLAFEPEFLRDLFEYGYEQAQSTNAWRKSPQPDPTPFDPGDSKDS
ncbi:MAG: patatin-like phospholipase family protein [Opitutales bacterium]